MTDAPSFIERDPTTIVAEMVAELESRLGKELYPAQVERLLVDFIAYRELLMREAVQDGACQNLVRFAREPMLAELAQLMGVPRVLAVPAETVVRLTFSGPLPALTTLPAGWQVSTASGVLFATVEPSTVLPGALTHDVRVVAAVAGSAGNGLAAGQIDRVVAVAVLPLESVSNLAETSGGADDEDVERWRQRIQAAPERYSWGGEGRYRELALQVAPDLTDVRVLSPSPDGRIDVVLLGANGPPAETVVQRVSTVLTGRRDRMLNDRVTVKSAQPVDYTVHVSVDVLSRYVPELVLATVRERLAGWVAARGQRLGGDIVPGQLQAAIGAVDGLYDLRIVEPAATRVLSQTQWPRCTGVTVQLGRVIDDVF